MTDKDKQIILAEIDRRMEDAAQYSTGAYNGMKEIRDYISSLHEEPVSDDLEEAADNALSNVLNAHEIVNVGSCLEMFKFGAKWQKEQMMAKAVDGEVTYGKSLAIPSLGWVLYKEGLDFGDKVKLVIIKED